MRLSAAPILRTTPSTGATTGEELSGLKPGFSALTKKSPHDLNDPIGFATSLRSAPIEFAKVVITNLRAKGGTGMSASIPIR